MRTPSCLISLEALGGRRDVAHDGRLGDLERQQRGVDARTAAALGGRPWRSRPG